MSNLISAIQKEDLRKRFGEELKENEPLAKFSSSRIGGMADFLMVANSADQLATIVESLWEIKVPFIILGGGSNILISDTGVRELVLLNKAKSVVFSENEENPTVWAESGSNLGSIARQAAQRSLSGLEWAAGVPGTLGGAIFGNAGAHGSEISDQLKLAEILQLEKGRKQWSVDQFVFTYRSSTLKNQSEKSIILSASLQLEHGNQESIQEKMDQYKQFRRTTQPPGASMGSMFKNPPDDFAGRLIEEAGLKAYQIGDAQISSLHANFFINNGNASAQEVYKLIDHARQEVKKQFDVDLELEIQLLGEWEV